MKIGAILTQRETDGIRDRARKLQSRKDLDLRTREQGRIIESTLSKAARRSSRFLQAPGDGPIEIVANPVTGELTFKD